MHYLTDSHSRQSRGRRRYWLGFESAFHSPDSLRPSPWYARVKKFGMTTVTLICWRTASEDADVPMIVHDCIIMTGLPLHRRKNIAQKHFYNNWYNNYLSWTAYRFSSSRIPHRTWAHMALHSLSSCLGRSIGEGHVLLFTDRRHDWDESQGMVIKKK